MVQIFWDGWTGDKSRAAAAEGYAAENGWKIIAHVLHDIGDTETFNVDLGDPNTPQRQLWNNVWRYASRAFTRNASEVVRAFIGTRVEHANTSIWLEEELPNLLRNDNVTKVIQIDPATGVETILKG